MPTQLTFAQLAEKMLTLPILHRANRLGGYGPSGEVIYEHHPIACPAVLVDQQGPATVTFQTNGSLDFKVATPQGLNVHVLEGSFDPVEKRETGILSANVWLTLENGKIASLVNPSINWNLPANRIKIIKTGDPQRAMWFCARFGNCLETALRLRLVLQEKGPAIAREICIKNTGSETISGSLWTYFNLHGTQRFVYHKQLWYDIGIPVSPTETVTVATVPHEKILQIKRVSSWLSNLQADEVTCDYTSFIGDSGAFSILPAAVVQGKMLDIGAQNGLNRFATASISASRFSFTLQPGETAQLCQTLLYVTDSATLQRFAELSACDQTSYSEISHAYFQAAQDLIQNVAGAGILADEKPTLGLAQSIPPFEINIPAEPGVAAYLNSAWIGVQELYEKCRGHGALLADGIELGTRDRAQDMFPKMKENPGQVRGDLLHALGFMYVTIDEIPKENQRLTLQQKLHGMFPRQFPSRWLDREKAVQNDNRPYSDSPLWLLDALAQYIRETGDIHILLEEVTTVRLTNEQHPEISGILGNNQRLKVVEVVGEIFAAYQRHIQDSPYGLPQILFGDWCDPVDMFGTSEVGNPTTRGQGRGAQIRLSAHVFLSLVTMIDLLETPAVEKFEQIHVFRDKLDGWKTLANHLRQSILKWSWESVPSAGFVDCLHELKIDGTQPAYDREEAGYTLGSMQGRDFDGIKRRLLTTQAYGLEMLRTQRAYLEPIKNGSMLIQQLLKTVDTLFFQPQLGLMLFSNPVANTSQAVRCVGRLGIVPPGCAENGEYHHAQMFMHRFRLNIPGQANQVWEQFKPVLSVNRDENIGGPFDMTSNSFVSDPQDPHFGKGMYFGLSGSIDWMIEILQKMAGVELAFHDDQLPDLLINPNFPDGFKGELTFKRLLFHAQPEGGFKKIPFSVTYQKAQTMDCPQIRINGKIAESASVWDVAEYDRLDVEVVW